MRALTVIPGRAGSARVQDVAEPPREDGDVLVAGLAVGVCGTDREIISGAYGQAPAGRERLVLGHESLGRVLEAPAGSGLQPGDLVAGIVRRPDPVPCECCARGEPDMCRNGLYTERGIKGLDGYASERWRVDPEHAVPVDAGLGDLGVLVEPASVVAKAWERIERVAARTCFEPARVLVTGAGPIGLLAAMLGVQRGLDVHVLDRVAAGPKPDLVASLGATYHHGPVEEACAGADVIVEATGVGQLVFDAMAHTAPGGIVCLTGVSPTGRELTVDAGAVNRTLVLENDAVIGSVNANRRHYEAAVRALARADRGWLGRLVTRRVPLSRHTEALESREGDVKVVIDLTG